MKPVFDKAVIVGNSLRVTDWMRGCVHKERKIRLHVSSFMGKSSTSMLWLPVSAGAKDRIMREFVYPPVAMLHVPMHKVLTGWRAGIRI